MKKSLLFLITATTLITGISCSDDNTNFDPIGDELGIPYKDGHDVYGVEVWTPEEVSFTDYYSLIDSTIHEKNTTKSIWWLSPIGEKNNIHWNYSAPVTMRMDEVSPSMTAPNNNLNKSQIDIDLTNVTDGFTIEAIITIGDQSIRRFQTIPVKKSVYKCDIFFYTFGVNLEQMEHDWINNEGTMNTATLKTARFVQSFQTIDFLGFTDPPLKN